MWHNRAAELAAQREALEAQPGDVDDWFLLRVPAARLSVAAFRDRFLARRLPCIISGLEDALCPRTNGSSHWDTLVAHVGSKRVAAYRPDAGATHTLGSVDLTSIAEAVAAVRAGPAQPLYVYDVPLRTKLPALLERWRVPRYIAHSYLYRTRGHHPFRDSWPTLFIGAPGSRSPTHLDRWHGHFWMLQLEGHKQWTIWHPADTALLEPSFAQGLYDPQFPPSEALAGRGRSVTVTLGPGELLFVPGGAVHAVRNLDASLAVAGNWVDATNLADVLRDLAVTSTRYADDKALFDALNEIEFDDLAVDMVTLLSGEDALWTPKDASASLGPNERLFEQLLSDCLAALGSTMTSLIVYQHNGGGQDAIVEVIVVVRSALDAATAAALFGSYNALNASVVQRSHLQQPLHEACPVLYRSTGPALLPVAVLSGARDHGVVLWGRPASEVLPAVE